MMLEKMGFFFTSCILFLIVNFLQDVSARAPTKIVGGTDATIEEFPSLVSIRDNVNDHVCGGMLITTKHVLTAAHCLVTYEKKRNQIIQVENPITVCTGGDDKGKFEKARQIEKIDVHELFDGNYSETSYILHDIGIITLKEAVEEGPTRKPIKLPSHNTEIGESAHIAGWGSVDKNWIEIPLTLQKAQMNISRCKILPGTLRTPDTEICAFNRKDVGFCNFDSGSPLIVNNEAVGIASWKWSRTCADGYPDVYTRVISYLEWIRNIIDPDQNRTDDQQNGHDELR
ncbi:chymotrypsin-2-like [Diachasmimorpha longicaudata]|uniref:chymotrypsin-2-like n=1 Tax=Diachasmimorpha longicaudata TaxID=58733 RepID=UPI0030B8A582